MLRYFASPHCTQGHEHCTGDRAPPQDCWWGGGGGGGGAGVPISDFIRLAGMRYCNGIVT